MFTDPALKCIVSLRWVDKPRWYIAQLWSCNFHFVQRILYSADFDCYRLIAFAESAIMLSPMVTKYPDRYVTHRICDFSTVSLIRLDFSIFSTDAESHRSVLA